MLIRIHIHVKFRWAGIDFGSIDHVYLFPVPTVAGMLARLNQRGVVLEVDAVAPPEGGSSE